MTYINLDSKALINGEKYFVYYESLHAYFLATYKNMSFVREPLTNPFLTEADVPIILDVKDKEVFKYEDRNKKEIPMYKIK